MRTINLLATLGTGIFLNGAALAQKLAGGEPSSDYLHDHNRALGFAAVAIQVSGTEAPQWKKLEAFNWCLEPIPVDTLPNQTTPSSASVNQDSCWDVLITTHYELFECPNGKAFILRSGVGAYNISALGAEVYAWSEARYCEGAEGGGVPDGTTVKPASANSSGMDQGRPLQFRGMSRGK